MRGCPQLVCIFFYFIFSKTFVCRFEMFLFINFQFGDSYFIMCNSFFFFDVFFFDDCFSLVMILYFFDSKTFRFLDYDAPACGKERKWLREMATKRGSRKGLIHSFQFSSLLINIHFFHGNICFLGWKVRSFQTLSELRAYVARTFP